MPKGKLCNWHWTIVNKLLAHISSICQRGPSKETLDHTVFTSFSSTLIILWPSPLVRVDISFRTPPIRSDLISLWAPSLCGDGRWWRAFRWSPRRVMRGQRGWPPLIGGRLGMSSAIYGGIVWTINAGSLPLLPMDLLCCEVRPMVTRFEARAE
jgi:hypothetical protein